MDDDYKLLYEVILVSVTSTLDQESKRKQLTFIH